MRAFEAKLNTVTIGRPKVRTHMRRVFAYLNRLYRLYQSRLDLAELTDDQLKDIGVSKRDARRELARPFWDGPNFL